MKRILLVVSLVVLALSFSVASFAADAELWFAYGSGSLGTIGPTYSAPVALDTSAPGWIFDHWSGDVSNNEVPLELTITKTTLIRANFVKEERSLYLPLVLR